MWIWIIIIAGMGFAFQLIDKILFDKVLNNTNSEKNVQTEYQEKPIMTASEINFYNKIKPLEPTYKILPQINLAAIIRKNNNNRYYTDLFRNIDYAIMSNDYSKVLLLIELNDATHEKQKRKSRDNKVSNIYVELPTYH